MEIVTDMTVSEALNATLTPENFATVREALKNRRIPKAQIVWTDPIEGQPWFDPEIRLEGEPVEWIVWDRDYPDGMARAAVAEWLILPCTVENCEGHELSEANDWDGLQHHIKSWPFAWGSFDLYQRSDGSIYSNATISFDGDVEIEDAPGFGRALDELAAAFTAARRSLAVKA